MKTRTLTSKLALIALTAIRFANQAAHAESDVAFDARLAAIVSHQMQRTVSLKEQLQQQYLKLNRPRLEAGYRQYLASAKRAMTFEQFAESKLMTGVAKNAADARKMERDLVDRAEHRFATLHAAQ